MAVLFKVALVTKPGMKMSGVTDSSYSPLGPIVDNFSFFDPITGTNLTKSSPESGDLTSFKGVFQSDGITPKLININRAVRDGLLVVTSGSLDPGGLGDALMPMKGMFNEMYLIKSGLAYKIEVDGAGTGLTVTATSVTAMPDFPIIT